MKFNQNDVLDVQLFMTAIVIINMQFCSSRERQFTPLTLYMYTQVHWKKKCVRVCVSCVTACNLNFTMQLIYDSIYSLTCLEKKKKNRYALSVS